MLSAKSQKTIAFIYDKRALPLFLARMIISVNAYAQERRSTKVVYIPNDLLTTAITSIAKKNDGILLLTNTNNISKLLAGTGLPMVTSDMGMPFGVPVDTNPEAVGDMAATFFLRRKFTNFAVFCSPTIWFDRVRNAFAAKVRESGYNCMIACTPPQPSSRKDCSAESNTVDIQEWNKCLAEHIRQWIPNLPHRCAVLGQNDYWAMQIASACLACGRAVPDDIAVMGLSNDIAYCSGTTIPITSVEFDIHRKVYTSLQTLEYMIDHPGEEIKPNPILIPPVGIVERESTNIYPVDPPWLAKTLLLLDANIDKPISISELAAAADVSPTTLQTAIHNTFGVSANKYILSIKMSEAKRLADTGKFSVKEIAARTGYTSASYFTRAYCAYYGHPPSIDCAVK